MKKCNNSSFILLTVSLVISLAVSLCPVQYVHAQKRAIDVAKEHGYDLGETYQPAGSIITEINTRQILWADDAQVSWAPASMTKLMVILIAYDAMAEGRFSLETEVDVTDKYAEIGAKYELSNNRMQIGASYSVSEMLDLIIVPSSAAATFMLADMIEQDQDRFVELMNQKAASLGMKNTLYYNIVGVPNNLLVPYEPKGSSLDNYNVTTPEDYALLCSHLVKTYPDIINHTKHSKIIVKEGTPYEESFDGHHYSLENGGHPLKGTDGIKTGSSGEAGFNYSSTAQREDTRLIEIVMGVSTWDDHSGEEKRHLIGNAIMEDAFDQYEYRKVLKKGKHTINKKQIELKKDFWDCVPKNKDVTFVLENGKIKVDLEREYLPGYEEPQMAYEEISKTEQIFTATMGETGSTRRLITKVVLISVLLLVILLFAFIAYRKYRIAKLRKLRRRRRRQRRRK